jgi:hypothetical protein
MNSYIKIKVHLISCINFVNVIFEGVCYMSLDTIESAINYTLINPDSTCSLDQYPLKPSYTHTGFTLCQVEHHLRTKFATPILHAIDNRKNYDIFLYIYITIDKFNYIFLKFSVIFIFVVIMLVQYYVILIRSGVFF